MSLPSVKYVKTARRLGGKSVYVALHNPTIRAHRVNGKMVAYAGGESISRKEAAEIFNKLEFFSLAVAVSPDTRPEMLLTLVRYENNRDAVRVAIENLRGRKVNEAEIMKAAAENPRPETKAIAADSAATSNETLMKLCAPGLKEEFASLDDQYVAERAAARLAKRGIHVIIKKKEDSDPPLFTLAQLRHESEHFPGNTHLKRWLETIATKLREDSEFKSIFAIFRPLIKKCKYDQIKTLLGRWGYRPEYSTLIPIAIAASPDASVELLQQILGEDEFSSFQTERVVWAAAENLGKRKLSKTQLKSMAEDPSHKVRRIAAEVSSTPNKILFKLLEDKNPRVVSAALRTVLDLIR